MKKIIILLTFLLFLPIVSSLDECQGRMETDEVPCYIFLPTNTTVTSCDTIIVEFHNETINFYNQTMSNYSYYMCNATFNLSTEGTYTFYYSTGDSGSIIINGGRRMELLIYLSMVLGFLLLGIGLFITDKTLLSLSGIIFLVSGVFIVIYGFATLNNLLTNGVAITMWALGGYVLIRTHLDTIVDILNSVKV